MNLGVFALLFGDLSLQHALDKVVSYGLSHVEIGAGGFMGKAHCDPKELLDNQSQFKLFRDAFSSRELTISSLSCYGNPLHPDKHLAESHAEDLKACIALSAKLEIGTPDFPTSPNDIG